MNRAPITIIGVWCSKCGRYLHEWIQREAPIDETPMAVFRCEGCGTETRLDIAWDDLDPDDRPLLEIVP